MKYCYSSFLLVAVVMGPLTNSAKAVTVKDCPKAFRTRVSELKSTKTVEDFAEANADEDKLELISYYLKNDFRSGSAIYGDWKLAKANNGRCQYTSSSSGNQKAEIYTTRGKDIIYLQTDLNLKGIVLRIYGDVESISPETLTLKSARGGLALGVPRSGYDHYSAGGSLVFFGSANKVEIK